MTQQPDPFHPAPSGDQPPATDRTQSPFQAPPPPYAGQAPREVPVQQQPYAGQSPVVATGQQQAYSGQSPFAAPPQVPPFGDPTAASSAPFGDPTAAPAPPTAAGPPEASPFGYPAAPAQPPGGDYPAYGQPPTSPYASYQPYSLAPRPDLASWGDRVVAYLLDQLLMAPAWILYIAGFIVLIVNSGTKNSRGVTVGVNAAGMTAGMLMLAVSGLFFVGVGIWNLWIRQGRTGQSWGKSKRGLYIVGQETGALIGMGNNILRQLAHIVDSAIYIGYLWPLWDAHKQTLADKIMKTVVIKVPR
ncbi:MAG TPA: RDD family protein [Dermatophilaceae bacterium]|nr:RDD family protein [Dermatophilaceae bacterium]